MRPVTPIVPKHDLPVVIYAKDQPEYIPLPAYKDDSGYVLTRWKLSWWERVKMLIFGNLYLHISTGNEPLQPVMLSVDSPRME